MQTPNTLKALTPDELTALNQDVKRVLTDLYGDRLDRVVLFGSYARGDFHEESDVDYLVVLTDENIGGGKEIRYMAPVIGMLSLRYDVEVSIFPTSASKYMSGYTLFYQAVQQEGIRL